MMSSVPSYPLRYEILSAERVTTKYGPSVLLTITIGPSDSVQVFLPTSYSNVNTDDDIAAINNRRVQLHLVYKRTCTHTHSYMLRLVS